MPDATGTGEHDGDHAAAPDADAVTPTAPTSSIDPALREALLRELAGAPDGVSLPRLIKRLNVRMSVLMRALAWLGDEAIGSQRGEGLVVMAQRGEIQIARLATGASRDDLPS